MLGQYYKRPTTVDRIRASWVGEPVEDYVTLLANRGYATRTILRRIPMLVHFGQFAEDRGATTWDELPAHVEPFVHDWILKRAPRRASAAHRKKIGEVVRAPIEQMLRMIVPGYVGSGRPHKPANLFQDSAPDFFEYLRQEKGLKQETIKHYTHHLRRFAAYLQGIELTDIAHLSPPVLSGFVAEYGRTVGWSSLRNCCGELRVFLRYLFREGVLPKDAKGCYRRI